MFLGGTENFSIFEESATQSNEKSLFIKLALGDSFLKMLVLYFSHSVLCEESFTGLLME